ncbi:MAG: hypothetical protein NC347_14855 [Clostridium sp.]|nr:hypothetical protein [Clostridium sp.]
MFENIFAELFAGVSSDTFDVIPLIPFGRWFLQIGVFLLAMGYCAERNDEIGTLSWYRYGTVLNWWKNRFLKGFISGVQKAVLLLFAVFVCDLGFGRASVFFMEENMKISVFWMFHIISLIALFLLFDLIFDKRFILAALLLFEGVTFILGYRIKAISHFMYGMWGMYLQSNWYETGGFQAEMVILAELLLLVASYYAGRIYLKKSGMCKIFGKEGF